jgi:DNA-binding NarL/FixJ family response regulator
VLHRPIDPAEHRAKGLETGRSPSAIIRCVLGRCLADPPSRGAGCFVRGRGVRLNDVWSGELETEETIRVAIADDQRLFANGLTRIIGVQPDMEVVGEAHTGEEAVSLCLEVEPDVVLMDLSMPVMDGVSATRKILSFLPRTRVLILTVHTDDAHVFQGIKAGAQGYILKDCTPEDLTRAIRAVHAGDTIMAQDIAKKMLTTFEGIRSDAELAPRLTERELEVVKALAHGKSNKEIAHSLGISEKTVRNHASNIYKKLHIFDRTQAVIYAIRRGLVDIEELEPR